ncbi:MAG: YbjN domain-containing protein [Deltaproteobacteria bacterium]|jgi:hypothetical protein|nr:YbjN domain-containing protein [Deltaproteobacteria bacterium]
MSPEATRRPVCREFREAVLTLSLLATVALGGCSDGAPEEAPPSKLAPEGKSGSAAVKSVTPQKFLALMLAEDLDAEIATDEDGLVTILWDLDGNRSVIMFYDESGSVLFRLATLGSVADMDDINGWNRDKRFSRGFLDEDGSAVLELDLDFTGGVSEDRIRDWLQVCMTSVYLWNREVMLGQDLELGVDDAPSEEGDGTPGIGGEDPPAVNDSPGTDGK